MYCEKNFRKLVNYMVSEKKEKDIPEIGNMDKFKLLGPYITPEGAGAYVTAERNILDVCLTRDRKAGYTPEWSLTG